MHQASPAGEGQKGDHKEEMIVGVANAPEWQVLDPGYMGTVQLGNKLKVSTTYVVRLSCYGVFCLPVESILQILTLRQYCQGKDNKSI